MEKISRLSFDEKRSALASAKKNRRLQRIGISIFIWLIVGTYFITPISKVNTPKVINNVYFTNNQIIEYSGLQHKKNSFLWNVKTSSYTELLDAANPIFLNKSKISVSFAGVSIFVNENFPVANYGNCDVLTSSTCFYLLNTSNSISLDSINPAEYQHLNKYLPDIIHMEFLNIYQEKIDIISQELSFIDISLISEVQSLIFTPKSDDFIRLYITVNDPFSASIIKVHFIDIKEVKFFLDENTFLNILENKEADCSSDYFFLNSLKNQSRLTCYE